MLHKAGGKTATAPLVPSRMALPVVAAPPSTLGWIRLKVKCTVIGLSWIRGKGDKGRIPKQRVLKQVAESQVADIPREKP